MKRNYLHLFVDVALVLTMLTLLATGLLIAYVLPPGHGGDRVWSLTRHDWGSVHLYVALATFAIIALHVVLNWTWVCTVCAKVWHRDAKRPSVVARNLSGVGFVLIVAAAVGGFLLAANAAVIEAGPGEGEHHHGQQMGNRHFADTASATPVAATPPRR